MFLLWLKRLFYDRKCDKIDNGCYVLCLFFWNKEILIYKRIKKKKDEKCVGIELFVCNWKYLPKFKILSLCALS